MVGITQPLWFWIKTLGDVVDSHSANCFTICALRLERGPAEKLATFHGVAGLAGLGWRFPGAFRDGANAGSEIAAVAQRIQLDAENGPHLERIRCNTLRRYGCRARHLDSPIGVLPIFILDEFAVGPDHIEVDLGMVSLCDKLVGHAG